MTKKEFVRAHLKGDGTAVASYERQRRDRSPRHFQRNKKGVSAGVGQLAADQVEQDMDWRRRHLVTRATGEGWAPIGGGDRGDYEIFISPEGNYTSVNLSDSAFPCAKLSGGIFVDMDMRECHMPDADMRDATMMNVRARHTNFQEADFSGAVIENSDLSKTDISGGSMRGATLRNVNLSDADLRGIDWRDATVENITLLSSRRRPRDCYEQHSFSEFRETVGLDEEEFAVALWAGNIEVRDNITFEVIKENFNSDLHHIPPWTLQNFHPGSWT